MKNKEALEKKIQSALQEIFQEEVTVAGPRRVHEAMKLQLLFSVLAERLLDAKQEFLDDKWIDIDKKQKGNHILHIVITALEEKGYL